MTAIKLILRPRLAGACSSWRTGSVVRAPRRRWRRRYSPLSVTGPQTRDWHSCGVENNTRIPPAPDLHRKSCCRRAGHQARDGEQAPRLETDTIASAKGDEEQVDIELQMKAKYGERMEFIHQEVYEDNDPNKGSIGVDGFAATTFRGAIRTFDRGLPSNWQVKSPSPARALLTTALAAMLFLAACGSEPAVDGAASARQQRITPGIEGLEQQANQLLDGGPKAFKARLAELEGHPVVVNQWASWCGPCRFEFPFFQRQAKQLQGRVAFLGVNTQDSRDNAAAFLQEHPVPYPHYFDPDGSVARVFRGGRAFPTTAFYDASGKLSYTHVGGYASEAKLQEEIERYAVDG